MSQPRATRDASTGPQARRRPAAGAAASRSPYTSIVLILTVATTSIAVFDLFLFATGLTG